MEKRAPARNFQDLLVWQKAHALVLQVYGMTRALPSDERYCLTSQLRRSIVSIPANIAEGFKKKGRQDKARFLNIAQGSLEESRYYLILVKDLGYVDPVKEMSLLQEVSKMLDGLIISILNTDP
jgi:four helix bundle protein